MTYFRVISVNRAFIKSFTTGSIEGMVTGVYGVRDVRDEGVSGKWSGGWLGPSGEVARGGVKNAVAQALFRGGGLSFLVRSLGERHYYDM